MKVAELLRKINEKSGVSSQELESLAASSSLQNEELQISDDEAKKISENIISFDEAKNSPDLKEHYKNQLWGSIKGEVLGNIDSELSKIGKEVLSEDTLEKFNQAENSKEKVKLLKENITNELETAKQEAKNGDAEKYKKQIDELKKQLENTQSEYEQKIKDTESTYKEQMDKQKEQILQKDLVNYASKYQFADAYNTEDLRPVILEKVVGSIKSEAKLDYDENGELKAYDKNNPEMELYKDGKPFDPFAAVEENIQPYIKKSDGNGPKGGNTPSGEKPRPQYTEGSHFDRQYRKKQEQAKEAEKKNKFDV